MREALSSADGLAALRLSLSGVEAGERAEEWISAMGTVLQTRAHQQNSYTDLLLAPDAEVGAAMLAAERAPQGSAAALALVASKLQLIYEGCAPPHSAGDFVSVTGRMGRSRRGQLSLYVESSVESEAEFTYHSAGTSTSRDVEGSIWVGTERFHLVPDTVRWERPLSRLGVGAHNLLAWTGDGSPPQPPKCDVCWLLPTTDRAAILLARQRHELAALGWRMLSCEEDIVKRLANKVAFHSLAQSRGIGASLPFHFGSLKEAQYPCILKAATGTYGRAVFLVASEQEARQRMGQRGDGIGDAWLLQELVPGRVEYSVSLLVDRGEIIDALTVAYTYDTDAGDHVWPRVREVKEFRNSWRGLSSRHRQVFQKLLDGFSGVCNFNYKLRQIGTACHSQSRLGGGPQKPEYSESAMEADMNAVEPTLIKCKCGPNGCAAQLAIFECNPRVGSDLAVHADRQLTREFFLRLDSLAPRPPPLKNPQLLQQFHSGPSAKDRGPTMDATAIVAAVIYLSDERDEAPRYDSLAQAPGWLRDELCRIPVFCGGLRSPDKPRDTNGTKQCLPRSMGATRSALPDTVQDGRIGQLAGNEKLPSDVEVHEKRFWDDGFLLRGKGSPALQLRLPPSANVACTFMAPKSGSRPRLPVAIICAGGGYQHINPREANPVADWLCGELGMASLILRYRLEWPQARDDILRAVVWVSSTEASTNYGLDADRLLVLGFSAGAHLSAHALAGHDLIESAQKTPQIMRQWGGGGCAASTTGFDTTPKSTGASPVKAMVLVYPPLDDAGGVSTMAPLAALSLDLLPAVYLVGSTNDRVCSPTDHVDVLADQMKALGMDVTYQRGRLGAHGFGLTPKWGKPAATWIRRHLGILDM